MLTVLFFIVLAWDMAAVYAVVMLGGPHLQWAEEPLLQGIAFCLLYAIGADYVERRGAQSASLKQYATLPALGAVAFTSCWLLWSQQLSNEGFVLVWRVGMVASVCGLTIVAVWRVVDSIAQTLVPRLFNREPLD